MFFVGATGQLLTLILTVCLPFVFILSGQQKITVDQTTFNFDSHKIHTEISSINNDTYQFIDNLTDEIQIQKSEFVPSDIRQILPKDFQDEWKSIYLKSSGNKAPPVFPCFSC